MSWYYAETGQQRGPVSDADLSDLVKAGTIREDTLVWSEGMADWQPYGQVQGTAPAGSAKPPVVSGIVCSQCGQSFASDEVIRIGDGWVCAACKRCWCSVCAKEPRRCRRRSGESARPSCSRAITRLTWVPIFGGLGPVQVECGILMGASVLVYLVLMGLNLIPYLSIILSLMLTGPLFGGLWSFYVKRVRGEDAGIADAFAVRSAVRAASSGQRGSSVLTYLCLFPRRLCSAWEWRRQAAGRRTRPGRVGPWCWPSAAGRFGRVIGSRLSQRELVVHLPVVADKRLNFWPAMQLSRQMVAKHWWATLWLAIVCGIFATIGILFCLVGALVTGRSPLPCWRSITKRCSAIWPLPARGKR